MKLHAFPAQAPTAPPPEARQGLDAKIWIPEKASFPEIKVYDLYEGLVPESLDDSLRNPKVIPLDLQNVLSLLHKIFDALIDSFVEDSSIEQKIPDEDFNAYYSNFWREFNSFIFPIVKTQLSHTSPIESNKISSASSSVLDSVPLNEAGLPEKPCQHAIITIQSISNGSVVADADKQKLIALKLYTGIEEEEGIKVLHIKGEALNETPISEYIRAGMERHLQQCALQDAELGRIQFWDKNRNLIRNPKPVKET
jgi:hypothetical protein